MTFKNRSPTCLLRSLPQAARVWSALFTFFDPAPELTTVRDATEQVVASYTYDNRGNRTSKTEGGLTTNYTYNDLNQITSDGVKNYTYDTSGNLISDGTYNYEWDNKNRLTKVTRVSDGTTVVSYTCEASGNRASKTAGSATTYYQYSGSDVVAEFNSAGNNTISYTREPSGRILSLKKGADLFYYHYNGHGDVVALTDANQNVVARWSYDAWGTPKEYNAQGQEVTPGTAGNLYLYAGHRYDTETGLYFLKSRYYNPTLGRFISRDLLNVGSDTISINSYVYARNNPVNLVDPTGLAAGTIYGRIINRAGRPIQWAAVRWGNILISGGNYILPGNANVVPTNVAGEFRVEVESGIYNMYYDAAGYQGQVQELITVWPGKETIVPTIILSDGVSYSTPISVDVPTGPNVSAQTFELTATIFTSAYTARFSVSGRVSTSNGIPVDVGDTRVKVGGIEVNQYGRWISGIPYPGQSGPIFQVSPPGIGAQSIVDYTASGISISYTARVMYEINLRPPDEWSDYSQEATLALLGRMLQAAFAW